MANVLLTDTCTRKCPYCFASKKLRPSGETSLIDFRTLTEIADFLERSRTTVIQLLGGEPTTHPDFAFFLDYLFGRGFQIKVFTNAMVQLRTLREILGVVEKRAPDTRQLRLIVNVNEPHLRSRREWALQTRAMKALGKWVSLSYNIHHPDCSFDFLADVIERYGTQKHIRFGLAAPVLGLEGTGLPVAGYRQAITSLIDFVRRRCLPAGIGGGLDCGFPLCLFDNEALGLLFRSGVNLKFRCGPAIDIDARKRVWHCFPLSEATTVSLDDFPTLQAITDHYREAFKERRQRGGIFPECPSCDYRARDLCEGGCMAGYLEGPLAQGGASPPSGAGAARA